MGIINLNANSELASVYTPGGKRGPAGTSLLYNGEMRLYQSTIISVNSFLSWTDRAIHVKNDRKYD